MAFELKELVLNGTREDLVEYNYNEMLTRFADEKELSVHQIGPNIITLFKTMAQANADVVIAMRRERKKK